MTREERYPFELRYTGSPLGWFEDGSYEYDVWSRHKTYENAERKCQYLEQFTHGSDLEIIDTRTDEVSGVLPSGLTFRPNPPQEKGVNHA